MDLPTIIPTQNNHRVVHFSGDMPRGDFERLEELAADGVAAAREALALVPLLPTPLFNALQPQLMALFPHVERRRLLGERAREELELFVQEMNRLRPEVSEAHEEAFKEIGRLLLASIDASHRVADLVAAEQQIGWLRGIRD
ncbi:hypothetical protein RSWS8N_12540 [Cereibacter sphaeroides WS8N]|uniref:hypothetical protein n=1 Tax=Cereibacter sphaeroides TaxID=1063 RepID=UPI00020DF36D|nr:hypothetical protein [Cereibacter sphaeroides]EGJ22916.1 hypothetical protein RSWS8N_12540 [Cereibacter sphaeroides WS8N]MWP40345.1 hypothetical protein [Cereibacter sphaeroides]